MGFLQGESWIPSNKDAIKTPLPHASGHSTDWSFSDKETQSTVGFPGPTPSLPPVCLVRADTHIPLFPILWWGLRSRETPTVRSSVMPSSACVFGKMQTGDMHTASPQREATCCLLRVCHSSAGLQLSCPLLLGTPKQLILPFLDFWGV